MKPLNNIRIKKKHFLAGILQFLYKKELRFKVVVFNLNESLTDKNILFLKTTRKFIFIPRNEKPFKANLIELTLNGKFKKKHLFLNRLSISFYLNLQDPENT